MKQIVLFFLFLFSYYKIECLVTELTDKNFDAVFDERKKGLVMFYSPGCGHCQRLKPTYEQLSNNKEIKTNNVLIARVDCTDAGKTTCQKYSVRGYPTVLFLNLESGSEVQTKYEGNRELNDLVKFVLDNSLPSIREIAETDINDFITSDTVPVVFGIFKDKQSPLFEKLSKYSSSNRNKFQFGYTFSKNAASKLDKKMDCVIFYRQQLYKSTLEPESLVIDSPASLENILDANRFSLVELRNPNNEKEFEGEMVIVYVGFDPVLSKSKFKRIRNAMIRVTGNYQNLKFFISRTDDYREFITGFAPNTGERDLHVVAYDKNENKYVNDVVGSYDNVTEFQNIFSTFVQNYLKGDVYQRYIKSEAVPTNDVGPVKTVVGSTFDSIVLDDTKDVFIKFYAPWCGHCKELAPKFEKLAKTLSSEENLVIAKIDATANEVHKNFQIQGFPTIFLAKAGNKDKPIQYNGERTVEAMIEWLRKETTHPIKYVASASDPKNEL